MAQADSELGRRGLVNFAVGTLDNYNKLTTKNDSTLYFITGDNGYSIYKGSNRYTGGFEVVTSLPTSGQAQGVIYYIDSTKTGSIWNGTSWVTIFTSATAIIEDSLTSTATDKALSAKQGKAINDALNTHKNAKATSSALGHIKSGGDLTIDSSTGIATVSKINGTAITMVNGKFDSGLIPEDTTKAPKASPTFTGTVTVPTPTSANAAANKAYVDGILASNDAMVFKGTIGSTDSTVTALPTTYNVGWTYRVNTAGTYAGQSCEVGDLIVAVVKRTGSGNQNSDWTVAQTNIDPAGFEETSHKVGTSYNYQGASNDTTNYPSMATLWDFKSGYIDDAVDLIENEIGDLDDSKANLMGDGAADRVVTSTSNGDIQRSNYSISSTYIDNDADRAPNTIPTMKAVSSAISGKMNGLTNGTANKIITSTAGSNVQRSDYAVSKTVNNNDTTVPTGKAVQTKLDTKLDTMGNGNADVFVTATADGGVQRSSTKVAESLTYYSNDLVTSAQVYEALAWGEL